MSRGLEKNGVDCTARQRDRAFEQVKAYAAGGHGRGLEKSQTLKKGEAFVMRRVSAKTRLIKGRNLHLRDLDEQDSIPSLGFTWRRRATTVIDRSRWGFHSHSNLR